VNRAFILSGIVAFAILLLPHARAAAEEQNPAPAMHYPVVRVLSRDDALFVQQQAELDEFRRIMEARTGEPAVLPSLDLFSYARRPAEDLFSLNARLGLRYETLASLNGAENKDAFNSRSLLLIPSQDGIFVSDPPRGELETMMLSTRLAAGKKPLKLQVARNGRWDPVSFFPDEAFSAMERAFFLRILYRNPIDKGRITSLYGWRSDPFTGSREFHSGLDIGAPDGTAVHAARDGTVEEVGSNEPLGRFVVVTHPGGYQTIYGHLSMINVTIGEAVGTGSILGAVGHTGRATGPHLHFEVRTKSGTKDPLLLIRVNSRSSF
jgi:murein DD-endopeptidase MepM/ murein hydrolase activator NlpD